MKYQLVHNKSIFNTKKIAWFSFHLFNEEKNYGPVQILIWGRKIFKIGNLKFGLHPKLVLLDFY